MNDEERIEYWTAFWKEREDRQMEANEILRARVAQLEDVIESKKAHIDWLEGELGKHKEMMQKDRADCEAWDKERKGMCQAVTRANKARNAVGNWLAAERTENKLLRLMLKDKGFDANFLWKAKRAMEAQERLRELLQEDDNTMVHKSVISGVLKDESE